MTTNKKRQLNVNMILRQWLVIILIIGALALISWRVLSLGMADYYARSQPEKALAWRAEHPEALFLQAERLANEGSSGQPQAIQLARRALQANPLDGRVYRVLGHLAQLHGDQHQALSLYRIAARRAPRDLPSHAWLVNYYLRTGALLSALPHLDAMQRVQPELIPVLFPQLVAFATHAQTQPALGKLLNTSPPWRGPVLIRLLQEAPNVIAIAPLIEFLRKSPGGLSKGELSAWLERLTRDRHWRQAYRIWVSQLTPEQQKMRGNVFDGGFELTPSHDGFDWRIDNVPGARIDLLPTTDAGGQQALRVSFEDRRVSFNSVRQLLVLRPGQYRLQGRVWLDDLRSERGLVWTLRCVENDKVLASTEPLMGSSRWHAFLVPFAVPALDCGGQWLQLSLPARFPAEQQISGRVWFDDLRIDAESRD